MNDPQPQEPQPEEGKPQVPHGNPDDDRRAKERREGEADKTGSPQKRSSDTPAAG